MVSWYGVLLCIAYNECCVLGVVPSMVGNVRYTCLPMVVWLLTGTPVVHNDYCVFYAFVLGLGVLRSCITQ